MKTVSQALKKPSPEPQKIVIIYDGFHETYAGFANSEQIKKIIEILEHTKRRIPTQ